MAFISELLEAKPWQQSSRFTLKELNPYLPKVLNDCYSNVNILLFSSPETLQAPAIVSA